MVNQTTPLEELMDDLLDILSISWPRGALLSALSFVATLASLEWAYDHYVGHLSSDGSFISGFAEHLGWIYFGLPLLIMTLTFIFSAVTLRAYQHDHPL